MIKNEITEPEENWVMTDEHMQFTLQDGLVVDVVDGDVNFLAEDGKIVFTLSQWEFDEISFRVAQQRIKEILDRYEAARREK